MPGMSGIEAMIGIASEFPLIVLAVQIASQVLLVKMGATVSPSVNSKYTGQSFCLRRIRRALVAENSYSFLFDTDLLGG